MLVLVVCRVIAARLTWRWTQRSRDLCLRWQPTAALSWWEMTTDGCSLHQACRSNHGSLQLRILEPSFSVVQGQRHEPRYWWGGGRHNHGGSSDAWVCLGLVRVVVANRHFGTVPWKRREKEPGPGAELDLTARSSE